MSPLLLEGYPPEKRGKLMFEEEEEREKAVRKLRFAIPISYLFIIPALTVYMAFLLVPDQSMSGLPPAMKVLLLGLMVSINPMLAMMLWTEMIKDRLRVYEKGITLQSRRRLWDGRWSSFVPAGNIARVDLMFQDRTAKYPMLVVFTREQGRDGRAAVKANSVLAATGFFPFISAMARRFPELCSDRLKAFIDLVREGPQEGRDLNRDLVEPLLDSMPYSLLILGGWGILIFDPLFFLRDSHQIGWLAALIVMPVSIFSVFWICFALYMVGNISRTTRRHAVVTSEGLDIRWPFLQKLFTTKPRVFPFSWIRQVERRYDIFNRIRYCEVEFAHGEKFKFGYEIFSGLQEHMTLKALSEDVLVNPAARMPAKPPGLRKQRLAAVVAGYVMFMFGLSYVIFSTIDKYAAQDMLFSAIMLIVFAPMLVAALAALWKMSTRPGPDATAANRNAYFLFKVENGGLHFRSPGAGVTFIPKSRIRQVRAETDDFGDHCNVLLDDGKVLDLPLDFYPDISGRKLPRKYRLRKAGQAAGAMAFLTAWMLLMVGMIVYLPYDGSRSHQYQPEPYMPVSMTVNGDKTISDVKFDAYGDVVINKGGRLTVNNCTIAMNGTFRVRGELVLNNTRLCDTRPVTGFAYNSRVAADPLVLSADLEGCSRARLDCRFASRLHDGNGFRFDIVSGVERSTIDEINSLQTSGPQIRWQDLSKYCGEALTIEIVPVIRSPYEFRVDDFQVGDFRIETDRGNITQDRLVPVKATNGWQRVWWEYPFNIVAQKGTVRVRDCFIGSQGNRETIELHSSTLDLGGSVLAASEDTPNSFRGAFIGGYRSTISIERSSFENRTAVVAENSSARLAGCEFTNATKAVSVRNTGISVDGCAFRDGGTGLVAYRDRQSGWGSAKITKTDVNASEDGLVLLNLPVEVKDCVIRAPTAVCFMPQEEFTRQNCTVTGLFVNNSISPLHQSQLAFALYCAVPVSGMSDLFNDNRLDTTHMLLRFIPMTVQAPISVGTPGYLKVDFWNAGHYDVLDREMRPVSDQPYSEGWRHAVGSPLTGVGDLLDEHLVDAESYTLESGNLTRRFLDEGPLRIRAAGEQGIAYATNDTSRLERPDEPIRPVLGFREACDITLGPVSFNVDATGSVLDISVWWSDRGKLDGANTSLKCSFNGESLVERRGLNPYDTESSLEIGLDKLLSGGDIEIRVDSLAAPDENLSDNRWGLPVTVFRGPRTVVGESDLSGLWVLDEGAELTLKDCNLTWNISKTVAAPRIIGLGASRLNIQNCSINVSQLELDVAHGYMKDSEILGPWYSSLKLSGGDWEIDNTTIGTPAAGFDAARDEMLAALRGDPDAVNLNEIAGRVIGRAYSGIYTDVDSLRLDGTRIIAVGAEISANRSAVVSNSTVVTAYLGLSSQNILYCGGNLLLSAECFFGGTEVDIRENEIGNDRFGFLLEYAGNCTIRNNTLSGRPGNPAEQVRTGLSLTGPRPPDITGNRFSDFDIAISLNYPNRTADLVGANVFDNITQYILAGYKKLTVEVSADWLEEQFNNTFITVTCRFTDVTGAPGTGQSGTATPSSSHPGTEVFRAVLYLKDWLVPVNGTPAGMDSILVEFTAVSERLDWWPYNTSSYTFERTFPISTKYSWTEYVG